MNCSSLSEARAHWDSGRPLFVGELLYERLPVRHRPTWAANILDLCCGLLSSVPPAVENVLMIAWDDARWPEAHNAFQAVRQLTLAAERNRSGSPLYNGLLYLAENTAKVTYNASGEPAPFDHHAGWRIAANLRDIVDHQSDPAFAETAWGMLSTSPGGTWRV